MKKCDEWVNECRSSGAFDNVVNCKEAEFLVRQIQLDAIRDYDIRLRNEIHDFATMQKMNKVLGTTDFSSHNK
jgi:hypothetical protein